MQRVLLSIFAAAALLFAGIAPAQVATDAGKTGISRSMHLLCSSAVAASVTGTTSETTLATCTVPGGAMGRNGGVEIRTVWSYTNSANAKTLRIRFGGAAGTQYMSIAPTTTNALSDVRRIRNRNSASSQVGSQAFGSSSFGTGSSAPVTSSLDTSGPVDIVASCQLALSTETCSLEAVEVWAMP
jgi:hypothetical protein